MFITQFSPLLSIFPGLELGYKAYKATTFKAPLFQNGKTIAKTDPQYKELVKQLPGNQLKKEMQLFLDKSKIRSDLLVIEKANEQFCCAVGTNFGNGDAVIAVSPPFYQTDPNACRWVFKHEISHIKKNDQFTIPLITSICSLAATAFFLTNQTENSTIMSLFFKTLAIQSIAYALISQYRERRADTFAIAESSINELMGGRRFCVSSLQANIQKRTTKWARVMYSPKGEFRFDLLHPSFESRIQKIEFALKKQTDQLEAADSEQTQCLTNLILQDETQVDKAKENRVKSSFKIGPLTFYTTNS